MRVACSQEQSAGCSVSPSIVIIHEKVRMQLTQILAYAISFMNGAGGLAGWRWVLAAHMPCSIYLDAQTDTASGLHIGRTASDILRHLHVLLPT